MRFVTYNLWHGLSPSSPVMFTALEPTGRMQLRERAQVEIVRKLQPDVCFFQEVNPIVKRAPQWTADTGMAAAFQPDLVGLKLLGLGLPINLNSGLLTLAKPDYKLKKIAGVSLSRPGTHFVNRFGSWQLKEERFALFSEAILPDWGRTLLINTHLHHGLESSPDFEQRLSKLAKELEVSNNIIDTIQTRLAAGSERRKAEIHVLLNALHELEDRYDVVILGGDFNESPEGGLGSALTEAGFRDVWAEAHPEGGGLSYDSAKNEANHFMQRQFPLTLVVEDLSFSLKVKEALLELARAQEDRPRRIDYLWIRSKNMKLKVSSAELSGLPDAEGLAPSDHFAVTADVELA